MSKPSPKTVTASLGMERSTLATTVTARWHTFGCDEAPPRSDSTDAPYDFFLAGLAACTTLITIRLSAEAKGIPLEGPTSASSLSAAFPKALVGRPTASQEPSRSR